MTIDGKPRALKLTLGALAELEQELGTGTLVELVQRFEGGAYSSSDVLALIVAGLRGGGADVTRANLMRAEIEGGPMEGARAAAELLARAFMVPDR